MKLSYLNSRLRLRWLSLFCISIVFSIILNLGHFPAAVLLGCMFSGILISTCSNPLHIPRPYFALAQGIIGCLMARSLQPQILSGVINNWFLYVSVSFAVFSASIFLGWFFMRRGIFPGSTAVWGLAPGAAAAMVVMAESYGADVRLVAFMQYLRVSITTVIAAAIAHFYVSVGMTVPVSHDLFAVNKFDLIATIALSVGLSMFAYKLRIPGGSMLLPLVAAVFLQYFGLLEIELPTLLLVATYAVIGWSVGLRFNGEILRHAINSLHHVLLAIGTLIILSGLIAVSLWKFAGYDLFTAYLATSPGGADSVAVIAATSAVDVGFVMAMQLSRFLFVLIFGPIVSRYVATKNAN